MKEANRNPKTHSLERLDIEDSRVGRPTNRDIEIVMVNGKEFKRSPRTSLKRSSLNSDVPPKPGFRRRWVSTLENSRVQDLVDLGYKTATDEIGNEFPLRIGGKNKQGEEFALVCMEISEEMHSQIERDNKQRIENRNKESLEKMKNLDLGSNSSTYIKEDSQKIITKQN